MSIRIWIRGLANQRVTMSLKHIIYFTLNQNIKEMSHFIKEDFKLATET